MAYDTKTAAVSQRIVVVAASGGTRINSAELVWQQLRDRDLVNCCYDTDQHIVDACCEAWNKFTQIPDAIRSLCTRNWANLASAHGMS
jgi:hypothetical protein